MQRDQPGQPGPGGAMPAVVGAEGVLGIAVGNLQALVKSGDILARGFRLLNTALVGNAWMTLDDSIAELQARMSCGNLRQLLSLEADIGRRSVSRSVQRLCVVVRMAGQLSEDAAVPLQRRVDVVLLTVGEAVRRT